MSDLAKSAGAFFSDQFDGVIRIEVAGGEPLWVDGRVSPPAISEKAPGNVTGDFCLWQGTRETMERIFSSGARQLETSYIAGRLSISGDMAVMARLEPGRD